ncbi:hypothetical protein PDIP_42710 [Penicillium digitatum Pd1]|uniref:Uncharacterized protein n=1 Tax=Penicillium digitatum (strain Pd1 / CECT 20795) TaxID=1170230 RepID=K9G1K4_PEND1|nr:hypothetical protein PDIP_42710 [Penicillium digitatum Pd1]EKV14762.1 hypothetical protein PDIP_42710 [Penicillium digitatum Pd1]
MGKPTRVWDLYLAQALFATRVREHATSGKSPSYLVYGTHPRLPGDTELVTSIRSPAELDNKIIAINHARASPPRNEWKNPGQGIGTPPTKRKRRLRKRTSANSNSRTSLPKEG